MLTSGFIIIASSVFFLYWFRYTCLLLLAREDSAEYAFQVAANIKLSFPQVQAALQAPLQSAELDRLREQMDQDYLLLTELLGHPGMKSIEGCMLRADYQLMRVWYQVMRKSDGLLQARKTLAEMSSILGFFAAQIGASSAA